MTISTITRVCSALAVAGLFAAAAAPVAAQTVQFNAKYKSSDRVLNRFESRLQFNNNSEDQWVRHTDINTGADAEQFVNLNPKVRNQQQISLHNKDLTFSLSYTAATTTFQYSITGYNGTAVSTITSVDDTAFNLVRFNLRSLGTNGGTATISYSDLAFTSPTLVVSNPGALVTSSAPMYQSQFAQSISGTNGTMMSDYDWTLSGKARVSGNNSTSDPKTWIVTAMLNPGVAGTGASLASVSAVPEPGTYALMLAGLAGVGFLARRRKSA